MRSPRTGQDPACSPGYAGCGARHGGSALSPALLGGGRHGAGLRPGAFGILEPPADLPAADPAVFARPLALIPCLAAGRDGVRLGRGGGYYDRFLAHYKGAKLLLCPEAVLTDTLPCDDWDAHFAPEEILTEKGIQV